MGCLKFAHANVSRKGSLGENEPDSGNSTSKAVAWDLDDEAARVIDTKSKLNSFDYRVIKSIGGSVFSRGVGVNSKGSDGGLISLWRQDLFEVKACIRNDRCIILSIINLKKEVPFCNIYATNQEAERKALWDFILTVQTSLPVPWCLEGDFNTILDPYE
ncbi:hypothetical protein Ddye_000565 [Dipteronia dyeriana]|uniref:Endonuclease/exonuclease/phosphatase domain-containing protein n=1 Tax=Dipteronia dyeriana TaxID=168575 RepID=A0AAE0CSN9_9ROSI|nr:hypothetical protein Ddye_000565 [Dipteronia dyeriana]